MLLVLYSLSAAAVLARASSSLSVSYPLSEQLPPIARIPAAFSWQFSPDTFLSGHNSSLVYSTSALPAWLSFDPATRTLSGTPSEHDEGKPKLTVVATDPDSDDSASASVTLCVTPYPPPELNIPVEHQFDVRNPSLSSVYVVSNTSALYAGRPALRVPPKWSFSIGFDYNTFSAENSLYYAARQADGAPLPSWINFNQRAMTFNGVSPHPEDIIATPHVVQLTLHASDQQGYSAASVPFDLIVASHDLSLAKESLPTINVTAGQPFELTLNSAVDFSGVLMDGQPVSPSNITSLDIDTSDLESWLRYDPAKKTLSGQPPSDFAKGVLPVTLTSNINQTLETDVTIAAVPSFFASDSLDSILVNTGTAISFSLFYDFANNTGLGKTSDVALTAAYDPLEASDYLTFDSGSYTLSGTVPSDVSYQHVTVTFTAYSHVTHSTSHTVLPISLSSEDFEKEHNKSSSDHGGLSGAARAKLILGLKIAFGIICGFVNVAILFAVLRRCSRVADTAEVGESAQRAWTDDEKRWYGIGIEVNGKTYEPPQAGETRSYVTGDGSGISGTISRVLSRTLSNVSRNRSPLSPVGHPQRPPMMRKGEFIGKVRATARIVSDKYRRVVSGPKRPTISKPTLLIPGDEAFGVGPMANRTDIDGLPFTNPVGLLSVRDLRPHPDSALSSPAASGLTSLVDSPTSSTDGRSIPRRRADFAPPVPPARAIASTAASPESMDSVADSLSTHSSTRTHEAEAVIQRATRATSVRSGYSFHTQTEDGLPRLEAARPRLVPFTHATRVPVPKLPSSFFSPDPSVPVPVSPEPAEQGKTVRVVSQMAKVFRGDRSAQPPTRMQAQSSSMADELRAGIEYVRALGDDGRRSLGVSHVEHSPAGSSAISFSSLESSTHGHGRVLPGPNIPLPPPRMLARTGERFKFRVPVFPTTLQPPSPTVNTSDRRKSMSNGNGCYEVRLVSGRVMPKFVHTRFDLGTDASVDAEKRAVELWGVPVRSDVGEYEVGVYEREGGACVGRVIVEVVERKTG